MDIVAFAGRLGFAIISWAVVSFALGEMLIQLSLLWKTFAASATRVATLRMYLHMPIEIELKYEGLSAKSA